MNLNILLALYGSSILGVIAYFLILPRLGQQAAGDGMTADGRLNFYTAGTGELEKCFPYTFRVMVSSERVTLPRPQVNVICKPQIPPELQNLSRSRGVMLSGNPKKLS